MTTSPTHLDALTGEGALYERLPDNAVRCVACGHRCLIRDGRRGICKVRFNDGGTLRVPRNYVAALQCDPVEKKPFFHVLPGTNALTFGMLGCDFHCAYCFVGDTVVVTDGGPLTLEQLFESSGPTVTRPAAEFVYPTALRAVTGSGTLRRVKGIVRHRYEGELRTLRPYYLPPVRCTPDHRVYATTTPTAAPAPLPARELTTAHYLAIPRPQITGEPQLIDVARQLAGYRATHRVGRRLADAALQHILAGTARGESSRAIAASLGKTASYVRHVRARVAHGRGRASYTAGVLQGERRIRFAQERRPGIPATIALDAEMAELLGYYCAEGCVIRSRRRPNSYVLNFSFSRAERVLASRVAELLERRLDLRAYFVDRTATRAVAVGKTSASLLFRSLCGGRAATKRVPTQLFAAPLDVVEAFLRAYVAGDGHRYLNGKVHVTTVSRSLAYGVAWLVLRTRRLPSIYDMTAGPTGSVQGRAVWRAPHQYSVVWYESSQVKRRVVETPEHFLVPLKGIVAENFAGDVYNMEVETEHNYLAGFFLVSNCQNWLTSQALRDPRSTTQAIPLTAEEVVAYAEPYDGRLVVSSYNEPLITSEWAVEVFKVARSRGLLTGFVSNGNATAEALDYVRPHADCYKIDLKTMNDRHYRQLGGVLRNVLDSIRMVHERGFWLEVVTLVVPGFSSDEGELRAAAEFLAGVDRNIPWHVTAFHEDYKMWGTGNTTAQMLVRACEIGAAAGLNFVYAGNVPGRVGPWEQTRCPSCSTALIERLGFHILANRLGPDGECPSCHARLPGLFSNPRGTSAPSRGHGWVRAVCAR